MLAIVAERLRAQNGPLSRRLKEAIALSIRDGSLPPNRVLPPERDMAEALGVSRSTLRASLKDLVAEGLVQTQHGFGTVVVEQIKKALSRHSGFSEDVKLRGLVPSSDVLSLAIGPVSAETALRTGMPLGSEVMTLVRLRRASGQALSYESVTVPVWAVGADFDGSSSLYDRMKAIGTRPRRMLQVLEAISAPVEIATLLEIELGAPILRIAQVGYQANGQAVEDSISWYRGDRYKYVGEIEE